VLFRPASVLTIAIPIGKHRFYYNHKVNCLPADGYLEYGARREELSPQTCLGSLDWGRGVWEYKSFWNWASASGFLPDGRTIGLNLGCGFGDTSAATEDCLVLDGCVHKLGAVKLMAPGIICTPEFTTTRPAEFTFPLRPEKDEPGCDFQRGTPGVRPLLGMGDLGWIGANRHRWAGRFCRRAPGEVVVYGRE
jgi:hypothetical protein